MNPYAYAGNNPITFTDPFGLCPPKDDNKADCDTQNGGDGTVVLSASTVLGVGQAGGLTAGVAKDGEKAILFLNFDFGVGGGYSNSVMLGAYNTTADEFTGASITPEGYWSDQNNTTTAPSARGFGFSLSRTSPNKDGRGAGFAAGFGSGASLTATQPTTILKLRIPLINLGSTTYECAKIGTGCN